MIINAITHLLINDRACKKYQPRKKFFFFRQLVGNFDDFQRNNSVFMQNKIMLLKNINHKKNYIWQLVANFADF